MKRVFAIVRAIINLSIQEYGLSCKNAFASTYIPNLEDSIKRQPIPIDIIRDIQKECMKMNDPNRWLIALISDTGMRLSEALGLKVSDIKLDEESSEEIDDEVYQIHLFELLMVYFLLV